MICQNGTRMYKHMMYTEIKITSFYQLYILILSNVILRDQVLGWILLDIKLQLFVLIYLHNKKEEIIYHLMILKQYYMNLDMHFIISCLKHKYYIKKEQMQLGISLKFQVNSMKTLLNKNNFQMRLVQMKMVIK